MSNSEKWLYLMSSNAKKEYILDALETLALPKGAIQHYRYQLQYLGKDLIDMLPEESASKSELKNAKVLSNLKNAKVLSNYLYQIKEGKNYVWKAAYPVRFGTLMDAYKTGESEHDVAHFYFKVEEHVSFNNTRYEDFFSFIHSLAEEEDKMKYAFYKKVPENILSPSPANKDRSDFTSTCEIIDNFKGPKDPPDKSKYIPPVFCYIRGIKNNKGVLIEPRYDPEYRKSVYDLTEGERYYFEYEVISKKNPQKYTVMLLCDEKIFSSVPKYERESDVRYDEDSFSLVPSLLEREVSSELIFKLEFKELKESKESNNSEKLKYSNSNKQEPLNISINFETNIKINIWFRLTDAGADIFFGLGTASIAFAKLFEGKNIFNWWPKAVIVFYVGWIFLSFRRKLWNWRLIAVILSYARRIILLVKRKLWGIKWRKK